MPTQEFSYSIMSEEIVPLSNPERNSRWCVLDICYEIWVFHGDKLQQRIMMR